MALELKQVEKRLGADTHIYATDLKFDRGSFNVLLGTTLAGKTTLMQLMAGLDRPTAGSVWFDGKDVTKVAVQKRNVSMVYQQFINYPNYSVFDNIASPLRVARVSADEIKRRVHAIAELLRLETMLNRRPAELSGGQQQRTAMARALIKDADLVLLDEPLANLDFKLREELRDELPKLFTDRDCVVVYATTEPVEALLFGGMTAALHEGRVVQFGATSEIYRAPNNITSATVFSEPPMNAVAVSKRGMSIAVDDEITWNATGAAATLADGDYTFGIRPHYVTPTAHGAQPVKIQGEIKISELSGSESLIYFVMKGNEWISQAHGIHAFQVGSHAELYADVARGMYFRPSGELVA